MNEKIKHEGRLGEKEREAEGLRLTLRGLVDSLRDKLDPIDPVEELEAAMIQNMSMQFAQRQAELKGVLEDIRKIKKILGWI